MSRADLWQSQEVAVPYGATVRAHLGEACPLLVSSGPLPAGANAGTDAYPLITTGPYLKVQYGLPGDTLDALGNPEFTFAGEVKVVRKSGEFCRTLADVTTGTALLVAHKVGVETDPTLLARDEYLDSLAFLDEDLNPGVVYYYTVFYLNAETAEFEFSSLSGFAYAWAYSCPTSSPMGEILFSLMTRYARVQDIQNGGILERFCQALGRVLDSAREEIDFDMSTRYDPLRVPATRIPYIDQLLGWPTNFEAPENQRRIETSRATEILQDKGTLTNIETLITEILGWAFTIIHGRTRTFYSFGEEPLDPLSPPADWNPATDGDWAALTRTVTCSRTFTADDPTMAPTAPPGVSTLCFTVTDDPEEWRRPFGALISLSAPIRAHAVSGLLIRLKLARLLPVFFPYYTTCVTEIRPVLEDEGFGLGAFGHAVFGL